MPTALFFLHEAPDVATFLPLASRLKLVQTSARLARLLIASAPADKWAHEKAAWVAKKLRTGANHVFLVPTSAVSPCHQLSLQLVPNWRCYAFAHCEISALLKYKQEEGAPVGEVRWVPELTKWRIVAGARPGPVEWYDGVSKALAYWRFKGVKNSSFCSIDGGALVGTHVPIACTVSSGTLTGVTLEAEGEVYVAHRFFEAHQQGGGAQRIATHINMTTLRVHARGAYELP